ncbi:MerR family transcriptional regulator [Pararhizobium sp. PWRC1-1]|uniref:MerR family transcriptional regulator n=1 Tax=Pararhizobium sp. PWRC1-1 TaxID=2804566 RepID=UPI003CEAE651
MDRRMQDEISLTALECSQRIGLSVRALRLYEQHGLISPLRTAKRWRLYGSREIARLNEILALKALGLSLSSIAKIPCGHPVDLTRTLALQHSALEEARSRAEQGLRVIEKLQQKLASGASASIDDLMKLAKHTNMTEPLKDTVAWRRYEQMRPREEISIDPVIYDTYVGAYELEEGPFCIVSRRDSRLFYRIVGQTDIEIFPETETQFFMKPLPVQITFIRALDGSVHGLIHHQDGFEQKAIRVNSERIKAEEEALKLRVSQKIAVQDSKSILLRVISEHARGEPDFDGMTPPLAQLAREQREFIKGEMDRAGPLKSLLFLGVSQEGADIYNAHFENANMEWGFALASSGKLAMLYLRPTP